MFEIKNICESNVDAYFVEYHILLLYVNAEHQVSLCRSVEPRTFRNLLDNPCFIKI